MLKISMPASQAQPEAEDEMLETPAMEIAEPPMEEETEMEPLPPDQPTLPKPLVVYMGSDFGPFRCDNCCYFREDGTCNIVEGEIDPGGCCNLYCPPQHQDGMEEEPDPSPEHEAMETPEQEMMEHATGEEAQDEDEMMA